MFRLPKTVKAWGAPQFADVFKREVAEADAAYLPLQQGSATGSVVTDNKPEAMVINASEEGGLIRVKAGIFYSGIIAGCSCADDPTPVNENSEYCEVLLEIDKQTGETRVTLLGD